MSRVLLFVQTGDGRPKCVGKLASPGTVGSLGPQTASLYEHAFGYWISPGKQGDRDRADRWWLVECENAEAGRAMIGAAVRSRGDRINPGTVVWAAAPHGGRYEGRILASGGKETGVLFAFGLTDKGAK